MKVREICHSITDGSHNPPQGVEESKYLMLSSKNIFDDEITVDDPRFLTEEAFQQEDKRTRIAPGDVLLTIVGTVGRTAVVSHDMPRFTLQRSVAVLHPKRDVCLSRFLMYALRSKRAYIEKTAKGVAQKGIYLGEVGEIDLPIPTKEQQESVIDTLDKVCLLIQTRQRQLRTLDTLIKARFVEMFGDPIINDRGWHQITLLDSLEAGRTVTYGIVQTGDEFENGTPVFRPIDIAGGHVPKREELKKTDPLISAQYKRTLLKGNELLITVRGSVGETFQTTEEFDGCNVGRNIVPLVTDSNKILQRFLQELFAQDAMKNWLRGITKGIALQGLNMGEFKDMPVIMPPIVKQKQFVDFALQVDKSKVAVQEALNKAKLLFDSLMQQYFG